MKITRGETVARQMTLTIEVDPDKVETHLDQAYKRLVQRTVVPGFRKGKAPRSVFERYVGREYLLEEALESLVPEAVNEAVEAESLQPATSPRVSVLERSPEVKLEARIALQPDVQLGDYSSLKIDGIDVSVSDEEIAKELENIREQQAAWQPVERELRSGDLATITAVGASQDKNVLNVQSMEYPVEEGSTYPVTGFASSLLGMKAGESRKFSLRFPDDYTNSDLAGKEAEFNVTLHDLKEKILPALDDELARAHGHGQTTFEELKAHVKTDLEAGKRQQARNEAERKVLDSLVALSTFEVAPILIDHEAEHQIYDQQQMLARYNVPLESYLKGRGKSPDQYIDETKKSAEERLKRSLVIGKFADTEKIDVTDEQIDAELERLKAADESARDAEPGQLREAVKRTLRNRMAMDRALEIAGRSDLVQRPSEEVSQAAADS